MSRLVKEKLATRFARVPASKSKGGKMLKQFSEVVWPKLEEYTNAECEPVLDSDETSEETPKLEEYTNAECEPVLDSYETSQETIDLETVLNGMEVTATRFAPKSKRGKIHVSQTPRSPPPLMQYLQYVVPTMLVLLTLRYEAKPEALFGKHRVPLRCFIATTSIYWLTAGVMKKMALTTKARKMCYDLVLSRIALASGIQSVLFLLSMFMNHVPPTIVSLLISAPIVVLIAYLFIKMVFGAGERNSTDQPVHLPV